MKALPSAGAWRAALVHLLLSLFLQGQNFWWMKRAAPDGVLGQAGSLLLFQATSVLAALLVGALVALLARAGALRAGWLVSLAAGLLAIADAWAFRALGEHLGAAHLPFLDSAAFLSSSLLAEIDFLVPLDVLLLSLGVFWQARAPAGAVFAMRRPVILPGAVTAYLALSASAFALTAPPELSWHPLASLLRNTATTRAPPVAATDMESVVAPLYGAHPADGAEAARLAGAAAAMAGLKRPNIVLVVLESTGARQLLRNGEIDAAVTPNLARLARHGVLFDQVYANIPGTLQANLAMSTGGRYPTWERLTDLMQYGYAGDLLARRLRQDGYRTGLFASADLAYLESRRFYAQAGYDTLRDFGQLDPERQHALRLNSWGGRDDATADAAAEWLDRARGDEQPFFLHFMTNAPHHPYQIPADAARLLPGDDDRSRYLNALHHADAALGILLRKVEASGQAGRTVFVVTGDHGEAYDPLPGRSQGHRRGIYEDAVRSFLLVSSPAMPEALRSSRIGNHGDLLPTVLALAGSPPPSVPGQNLLDERFAPRTVFFHYGDASGSWGLRDGRWKYISPRAGAPAELFDLDSDPDERVNLAAQGTKEVREKVQRYEERCSAWFFGRNAEFRTFLTGFAAAPAAAEGRDAALGLEALTTGVLVPDGKRVFFAAAHSAHPADRIALETRWGPTPDARQIVYRWQAPGGRQVERMHVLRPLETQQRVFLPGASPWPAGDWHVSVIVDGKKAGESRFEVTPSARAQAPANFPWPELVSLRVGLDADRHALPVREIPAGTPIHFESEWNISDQDRALTYALIAPSGKGEIEPFTVVAGQSRHSLILTPPRDAEPGVWSVVTVYRDREIGRAQFRLGAPVR